MKTKTSREYSFKGFWCLLSMCVLLYCALNTRDYQLSCFTEAPREKKILQRVVALNSYISMRSAVHGSLFSR